ncbi:MAG: redoxin domain-containing protein [Capsulimonas sp.]|uniref:redoxin domain-containing protein n=1 Tax=Capsulimonas sp. TaxID=2494211 RepID=UPI003264064E
MVIPASRRSSRIAFAALAAFSAATVPAWAAPVSPLLSAKTIHVEETWSIAAGQDKMVAAYKITTDIARPGSFHTTLVPTMRKGELPSALISDGTTAHEVNGFQKTYSLIDTPKAGEAPSSEISSMASLGVVFHPDAAPEAPEIKRTVSSDKLDGHAMTLRTDTYPTRSFGGRPPITEVHKLWIDAKTGLPRRRSTFVISDGKTREEDRTDFLKWTLNKPIAAKQFAWAPPAGITEHVEPKLLAVGADAPDFTATAPDGSSVKLSDYKGKTVILDFWATWCGPCQASMPHLDKVYQQVKDKDVVVLAVCVWDTKPEYDKWVAAKKDVYSFPTAYDPAGRGDKSISGSLYKVSGIPTQYIIDKDGKVAATTVGYSEGSHSLEDALKSAGVTVAKPIKSASAR